jgi:c-di-GMP-binding flagellar brake protein YcgR
MNTKDFREYPRIKINWEVFFTSVDNSEELSIKGSTINISIGGIFLKSKLFIFKEETILRITFEIPKTKKKIQVRGRVMHYTVDDENSGMGIKFIDLKDEDKEILEKYIVDNFLY